MVDNDELINLLKGKKSTDVTVREKFGKTADQYRLYYMVNLLLLRLVETCDFVARNFNSIIPCIEQCFLDTSSNWQNSRTELQQLIRDLSKNNTASFVLKMYRGCQFDYADAYAKMAAWEQYIREGVEIVK